MTQQFVYPAIRKDETAIDEYHGVQVPDPYRWLEDPDSEETRKFVDEQNALTLPFLQSVGLRGQLKSAITKMWDYPKFGNPFWKTRDTVFYFHNTGLQNQSVLYKMSRGKFEASLNSRDVVGEVFLDPNSLSADGTVALTTRELSEDGRIFGYALSAKGSDWRTVHFRDVQTNEDLVDRLEGVKFSGLSFTHDNRGVFYSRYPLKQAGDGSQEAAAPKQDGTETVDLVHQKVYYHVIGTPQADDALIAEFPEHPKWFVGTTVTHDGRFVLLESTDGCDPVNRIAYVDLDAGDLKRTIPAKNGDKPVLEFTKLIDNFDAEYSYVANDGFEFIFKTNLNAPRYKLIRINLQEALKTESANTESVSSVMRDLLPESEHVLEWACKIDGNKLLVCYNEHVKHTLYVHDLATGARLYSIELEPGTVAGVSCEPNDPLLFIQLTTFLMPSRVLVYSFDSDDFRQTEQRVAAAESNANAQDRVLRPTVYREPVFTGYDPSGLQTTQVFYKSRDGTSIPMYIVHRRGLVHDGRNPTLLYGYGGFSISLMPYFSPARLVFVTRLGGVVAIPNLRGGGEYGEQWHKLGALGNKQNCFDDFQAAAEYLISERYTEPSRLAINGGSNGGLLVAACANQRPDLFGIAIANVGVMDMLKFHKFTVGHAWITDYGCSDKAEQFQWLHAYSPLHNAGKATLESLERAKEKGTPLQQYPSLLLLTADHDDRVVPLHSYKLIAELQHRLGGLKEQTNPLLIRIDTEAGHGMGKPTSKVIEDEVDIYSFFIKCAQLNWLDSEAETPVDKN